jgi:hypothetical protein
MWQYIFVLRVQVPSSVIQEFMDGMSVQAVSLVLSLFLVWLFQTLELPFSKKNNSPRPSNIKK